MYIVHLTLLCIKFAAIWSYSVLVLIYEINKSWYVFLWNIIFQVKLLTLIILFRSTALFINNVNTVGSSSFFNCYLLRRSILSTMWNEVKVLLSHALHSFKKTAPIALFYSSRFSMSAFLFNIPLCVPELVF